MPLDAWCTPSTATGMRRRPQSVHGAMYCTCRQGGLWCLGVVAVGQETGCCRAVVWHSARRVAGIAIARVRPASMRRSLVPYMPDGSPPPCVHSVDPAWSLDVGCAWRDQRSRADRHVRLRKPSK
eukprot:scaffold14362_cov142-Isochrysis_galbana.AAC.7